MKKCNERGNVFTPKFIMQDAIISEANAATLAFGDIDMLKY